MRTGAHQTKPNIALSGRQQSGATALFGQHVAGIAHEMRNLLAIIQLQARMLPKKQHDTPQFQKSLAIIEDQAKRLAALVDTLLALRDSRGPRFERVDVNALLQYTVGLQADLFHSDGIQLIMDLDTDLPLTLADPFQLEQVFINIINNARQAMKSEKEPGKLTISTALRSSRSGGSRWIQIRFADNGPGIPPEVMPHIFEPFFTTKRLDQGTGLGLALCDRIARVHQGRIWAENTADRGAVFVLELPPLESAPLDEPALLCCSTPPAQATIPQLMAESHRILVVDDEPVVALTIEQILRRAGFQIVIANNGHQALLALAQERFDLIISDLKMPEMDGLRFYELVTSRHPHLARRIIFSTGDSSGQGVHAFLQQAGCAQLSKPFQADELLHLVYEALLDSGESSPKAARKGRP